MWNAARLLVLFGCLILLPGSALADFAQVYEQAAGPGNTLKIELLTGGSIEIEGWGQDKVHVEAKFTGKDSDIVKFEVEERGRGVLVRSSFSDRRKSHRSNGEVKIKVPSTFDIELNTMGGDVKITGVLGEISGETMGGDLILHDLEGELDLSTMGGDIDLSKSTVDGEVQTMGGDVHLRDVAGNVEATTMGGNVIYDNVESAGGRSDCREVRITTMGGNINAPNAHCGATLKTMGGNVSIEQAEEFVKAETMGGNIIVGAVDGWIKATTMGGNIRAQMVGDPRTGERHVRLTSLSGDVELTVPDGLSMDVDITLAYTKSSRQKYQIHSDFPLNIRKTENWDYDDGSPRKYIYGTGSIGGGEHKIKIETVNGDIHLKKK